MGAPVRVGDGDGGSLRTPAHVINLIFGHVTPSPQELLRVLTRLGKRCRKTETRPLGECACYSSWSALKITARPNRKNSAAAARRIQMIPEALCLAHEGEQVQRLAAVHPGGKV